MRELLAQLLAKPGVALLTRGLLRRARKGNAPGALATALKTEIAPTALGMAFGGVEGGLIGAMSNKAVRTSLSGLDTKRQAAFNAAIEQAVLDPDFAAKLAAEMGKRRKHVSPTRALVQAVVATSIATQAGTGEDRDRQ